MICLCKKTSEAKLKVLPSRSDPLTKNLSGTACFIRDIHDDNNDYDGYNYDNDYGSYYDNNNNDSQ